ncbi:MAG: dockerin type I repeat-containing protein [archaeon]|nr:dockerin type I repeat-containing protein [archaeon]
MNKKFIPIIAIVAAIVVVAAGYMVLFNGDNNEKEEKVSDNDGSLWILGNANGDSRIDSKDVSLIEDLVKKGGSIDINEYKMYDANNDGKITSADVTQVKALIAGTAKVISYKNIDGECRDFKVSSTGNYNIILNGRCVAEEIILLINKNPARYNIVAACKQCETYDEQLQLWAQNPKLTKSADKNGATDFEILSNIEKDLAAAGNHDPIVLCMGSIGYYNKDLEEKVKGDETVHITRLPSWEGNTMSGILTWGYLFGSQGSYKGTSAWQAAMDYEAWALKYLDPITEMAEKLTTKKTMLNVSIKEETPGVFTYSVQGPGSDPYVYSSKAGADNLGLKFGAPGQTGNVSTTKDAIAQYAKNVDVVISQILADAYAPTAQKSCDNTLDMTIRALNGWVSPNTDVYAMSFMIFNGAPYVLSMIQYAKMLYNDNSVIAGIDFDKALNEYLKLVGWDKRTDLNDMVLLSSVGHTTIKV